MSEKFPSFETNELLGHFLILWRERKKPDKEIGEAFRAWVDSEVEAIQQLRDEAARLWKEKGATDPETEVVWDTWITVQEYVATASKPTDRGGLLLNLERARFARDIGEEKIAQEEYTDALWDADNQGAEDIADLIRRERDQGRE